MENTTQEAIEMAQMVESAEQLDSIIEGINQLNTYIGSAIVIGGIVLSFFIVRFLWRLIFKPILRDFIKLPL